MTDIPTLPIARKDIVFGQKYRIRKSGDVIRAYLLPHIDPALNYQSIPDNAIVTVLGKETTNGEIWLKISYANFTGVRYIQLDLIDIRETTTFPAVKQTQEVPLALPDKPLTVEFGSQATPIAYGVEKTPQIAETQTSRELEPHQIAMLKQWQGELQFKLNHHKAEMEMCIQRLAFVEQALSIKV